MNIVFWALVGLAAVLIWLVLSAYFWDIGEFFYGLIHDAKDALEETNNDEEESQE